MSTLNIAQKPRLLRLGLSVACGLLVLISVLLVMGAAQPAAKSNRASVRIPSTLQEGEPEEFLFITDTVTKRTGRVAISGDCVAFRGRAGQVYLHHLTTGETFTITDKPDDPGKVAISQGVVVWRSNITGEQGVWGYYDPHCSDAGPFASAEVISPFHIVSRTALAAPAISGKMLTLDGFAPKGRPFIAAVNLDADDDGIPDATEPGYPLGNPADEDIVIPISWPYWQQGDQKISDAYWDDCHRIACWYNDGGGVPGVQCNDLFHLDDAEPWMYRFTVTDSTCIPVDYAGFLAVHHDLVVWTDCRDSRLSGHDVYIADLDLDDDCILNHDDQTPGEGPAIYPLVNRPWHQQLPDIWWPFAVWEDWRNGNQADVYAYDLSLDSDGDGVVNWKDPNRPCIDPAEIRVTSHSAAQTTPETWGGTVVWKDKRSGNWDIYGAHLQPVQPQPRVPVTGTAEEKALHWLDQQTVAFTQVSDIPGYIAATGMITRYKSFLRDGVEVVRQAWYTPTVGSYLVGFDYCYYGTPDQKRYLGRFGRGFTYDQGLALIARSMVSQPVKAKDVASYVSNYQNSGQLTTTTPGSLGFSFNGQGYWDEKDSFYDMDYLRVGADAWYGYGLLFHSRQYAGLQHMETITRVADYILSQQVLTPTDARYGLFTGGFGSWITQTDVFTDVDIGWVAVEHNIDTYFFLRDLGQMTGDSRYIDAATLQRANMYRLWDDEKGRFNQGMGITGTLNTNDALNAASWGSMYWTAAGDLDKAQRSLEYADRVYSDTVTITDSTLVSAPLTVWGYKPYSPMTDVVWSEGSLGAAMAYLKLGHAVAECDPVEGEAYIQKARDILAEMEKLQAIDPEGGVLYAVSASGVITDFPQAPSAAGTTWLLMVRRALEDEAMRDAFWGPDLGILHCVGIAGPTTGWVGMPHAFVAMVHPATVTLPINYVWHTGLLPPVPHTGGLSDTFAMAWGTSGPKSIVVEATNARNTVAHTHIIQVTDELYLPIVLNGAP